MSYVKIIENGLAGMNVKHSAAIAEKMGIFLDDLMKKNTAVNLTAITDKETAAVKHILDCAAVGTNFNLAGKSVIDIGCGAGFPGMPIKICDDSVRLTMLDSTEKKVNFIREELANLGLEASVVCARAEEAAHLDSFRQQFDAAVSRAVAELRVLAELCLPFVKVGGDFIAMKSVDCDREIADAEGAIEKLGGKTANIIDYDVGASGIIHRLVVIHKTADTPKNFPRRFSRIKNSPL